MITIIDYGMGNLGSIKNMIKKIGFNCVITSDPREIVNATKLILPGVGSFDVGMRNIREYGLKEILEKKVVEEKTPILGICLGMQLMTNSSEEGIEKGLGWVEAETVRFTFDDDRIFPHMGWNYISIPKTSALLDSEDSNSLRFYFVHSYFVKCKDESIITAKCNYGFDFTCSYEQGNIFATQFHPEKSHVFGMNIIERFLRYEQ